MLSPSEKIGYCNVEYILANYPATAKAEQDIVAYEAQLAEELKAKYVEFQAAFADFEKMTQDGNATEAQLQAKQAQLKQLENGISTFQKEAEQKVQQKQADLYNPIYDDLDKAIKTVADVNGFSFILNASDGGTSIVLHAPDANNLNNLVLKSLGAAIPGN